MFSLQIYPKRESGRDVFPWILKTLWDKFLKVYLRTTASGKALDFTKNGANGYLLLMLLTLFTKRGSYFSAIWGLLTTNSRIFVRKLLSKFFLYFSFLWYLNFSKSRCKKQLFGAHCLYLNSCLMSTLFRIGEADKRPDKFSPRNVRTSPQNILTFSFNPFATLM